MNTTTATQDPTSLFRLDGRVALVTGASSGIGAALAEAFARAGAAVVLGARRVDRIAGLAERIRGAGGRALPVALDVTQRAAIVAAFDAAERELGRIGVVVNCAGIAEPRKFVATDDASLDRIMDTNFRGTWMVCQEAAARLVAAKAPGSIVNVASILGIGVGPGYASYSSSKGAVVQLTRSLAVEYARHGIRVNALAPGWFVTEMNEQYFASDAGRAHAARLPIQRTGAVTELIGPALLLASDAGSYVSGVVLPVDAGHSIALI